MAVELQQIVFGWQPGSDMGPVADSGVDDVMRDRLQQVARMADVEPDHPRPSTSICYLRVGDLAAVLHRSRGPGDSRTDVSHALVGAVAGQDGLSASAALALARQYDWIDATPPATLSPVSIDLDGLVSRDRATARPWLTGTEKQLIVGVVAHWLADPMITLVVVDPDIAELRGRVLASIVDQLDAFTAGLRPGDVTYTFSTWEPDYHGRDSSLPQIVFAPEAPDLTSTRSNRAVVTSGGPVPPRYADLATSIFSRWQEQRDGVPDWIDGLGLNLIDSLDQRIDAVIHYSNRSTSPPLRRQSAVDIDYAEARSGSVGDDHWLEADEDDASQSDDYATSAPMPSPGSVFSSPEPSDAMGGDSVDVDSEPEADPPVLAAPGGGPVVRAPSRVEATTTRIPDQGPPLPPVPPSTRVLSRVEEAIKRTLRQGPMTFAAPDVMRQGHKERIEVGIARDADAKADLDGAFRTDHERVTEQVRTADFMTVELLGDAFVIDALSPLTQPVAPTAHWEFDVTPVHPGAHLLTLKGTSLVTIDGVERSIAIPSFDRQIKVDVDMVYGLRHFFSGNWQWLVATVAGLGGAIAAWISIWK